MYGWTIPSIAFQDASPSTIQDRLHNDTTRRGYINIIQSLTLLWNVTSFVRKILLITGCLVRLRIEAILHKRGSSAIT